MLPSAEHVVGVGGVQLRSSALAAKAALQERREEHRKEVRSACEFSATCTCEVPPHPALPSRSCIPKLEWLNDRSAMSLTTHLLSFPG